VRRIFVVSFLAGGADISLWPSTEGLSREGISGVGTRRYHRWLGADTSVVFPACRWILVRIVLSIELFQLFVSIVFVFQNYLIFTHEKGRRSKKGASLTRNQHTKESRLLPSLTRGQPAAGRRPRYQRRAIGDTFSSLQEVSTAWEGWEGLYC
jgi:hypothetical protein